MGDRKDNPGGRDNAADARLNRQSPSASVLGTWIAIWYKPAEPGASAAP